MVDTESKILTNAIGLLGGVGARWVSRFLPTVSHESNLELHVPYEDVLQSMLGFVAAHGYAAPELESSPEQGTVAVIVGSGHLNMNPTILSMHLARSTEGCSVRIRAVAKEGLVPQHSAQKLVRRVEDALKQ